jgi:hypothetical protein
MKVTNIFQHLFGGLKPQKYFLVIEVLHDLVQVAPCVVERDEKRFYISNRAQAYPRQLSLIETIRTIANLVKTHAHFDNPRIALVLDSSLARTIRTTIVITRKDHKTQITDAEFEDIISRLLWKVFDKKRPDVAKQLDVSEVDLVLADAHILNIKLDKHKVNNPLGFIAKTIELELEITYTTRQFFEPLQEIIPYEHIVLLQEAGTLWAMALAHQHTTHDFLLGTLFHDQSIFFSRAEQTIHYGDRIEWGMNHIYHAIVDMFGVDFKTAKVIFSLYQHENMSSSLLRLITAHLTDRLDMFWHTVYTQGRRKQIKTMYLISRFSLPNILQTAALTRRRNYPLNVIAVDENFVGENFGFQLQLKTNDPKVYPITLFLSAIGFHIQDSSSVFGRMVKRQARWISS